MATQRCRKRSLGQPVVARRECLSYQWNMGDWKMRKIMLIWQNVQGKASYNYIYTYNLIYIYNGWHCGGMTTGSDWLNLHERKGAYMQTMYRYIYTYNWKSLETHPWREMIGGKNKSHGYLVKVGCNFPLVETDVKWYSTAKETLLQPEECQRGHPGTSSITTPDNHQAT